MSDYRGTAPFGTGWLFGMYADGSELPGFDDSALAPVTLPHTVTPLSWQDWDPASWERTWVYRKRFDAPPGHCGQRVFLDFGAAMTHATVTLNGTQVTDHLGGYLPVSTEITGLVRPEGNVLAVRLDAGFNLNVPPDRPAPEPTSSVDYWQPGGLYREPAQGPGEVPAGARAGGLELLGPGDQRPARGGRQAHRGPVVPDRHPGPGAVADQVVRAEPSAVN